MFMILSFFNFNARYHQIIPNVIFVVDEPGRRFLMIFEQGTAKNNLCKKFSRHHTEEALLEFKTKHASLPQQHVSLPQEANHSAVVSFRFRRLSERARSSSSKLSFSSNLVQNQQQADNEFTQHRSRQEKILREISILRQGLLLKQREVASYPVAMVTGSVGANLPERTNELKQDSWTPSPPRNNPALWRPCISVCLLVVLLYKFIFCNIDLSATDLCFQKHCELLLCSTFSCEQKLKVSSVARWIFWRSIRSSNWTGFTFLAECA